ncbi:MAG: universal stress protein [Dialister sp.]|nr:universal stress protein [Dialister sp.]
MENSTLSLKKILVPVDGSKSSEKAFHYGLKLAAPFEADLILLYVVDVNESIYPIFRVGIDQSQFANVKQEGEALVDRLAEEAGPIPVKKLVEIGLPGSAICQYAKNLEVDMIIMGNSGKGAVSSFVMGSVSQYVIHHTKTPVLILK